MALIRRELLEPEVLQVASVDLRRPAAPGFEAEFEAVYRPVEKKLLAHARSMLENHVPDANDAVQSGMADVWRVWKRLRPEQKTAKYLMAAVSSRALNMLRDRRNEVEITDEIEADPDFPRVPSAEWELIESEDAVAAERARARKLALIDAIVATMPPRRRQVYLLVTQEQWPHAQIAAHLNITVHAVEKNMLRAYKNLEQGVDKSGWNVSDGTARKLLAERSEVDSDDR